LGHHGGGLMTKRLIGLDGEMSDTELTDGRSPHTPQSCVGRRKIGAQRP
jgi:hypothetical protein